MMLQRNFKRMLINVNDGVHLLHIGTMEIWDGADLSLLRDGLFQLIEKEKCRAIAIDMSYVKYIPSGFFGMLIDWQEKRSAWIALTTPQPNVQNMLWFRRFFKLHADGMYELRNDLQEPMAASINDSGVVTERALVSSAF